MGLPVITREWPHFLNWVALDFQSLLLDHPGSLKSIFGLTLGFQPQLLNHRYPKSPTEHPGFLKPSISKAYVWSP